ncbi:MAG: LptF/LptG family permease [Pseudomonadota bacterium]
MKRIDRYLLRQILTPMLTTLAIAAMLLLLDKMLSLFDFVIKEGGPVSVVWRMLGNVAPQYLGLAIPIGLLLGTILAFRKLALSSELDALNSVGVSFARLLRVPIGLSLLLAIITFFLNGFVQPISRYSYEELRYELRSGALGASIKVGEFVEIGDALTMKVEESRDGGRQLFRIFAYQRALGGQNQLVVTADSGAFFATDDEDRILFRLFDGTLITLDEANSRPRYLRFDVQDLPIDLPKSEAFRDRGDGELEKTTLEMFRELRQRDTEGRARNAVIGNLNYRLAHIMTLFVLPFLAVPMGIPPKRSASAIGVFTGVIILIGFNEVLELGAANIRNNEASPWVAIWLPYVVFSAISFHLYKVATGKVGGQPLKLLDQMAGLFGALFKRFQRKPGSAT